MTIQKPDSFELFQRYHNGNATKEENELITYWINKDEGFKQQLEQYRVVFSGLSGLRIKELEQQFATSSTTVLDLDSIEEVERYFNGQLSNDELEAFEYRLHTDPTFKGQVEQYKTVFDGLSALRITEIEKKVISAVTDTQEPISIETTVPSAPEQTTVTKKTGVIRRLFPLVAAAAAAVLLWFGLPFFMESDAAKFQRLQAEFNTTPKIENLMSAGNQEELMKQGKQAFLAKDYTKAITLFKQLETNEEATLYLGHAHYQAKQYNEAGSIYQSLQNVQNTDYSNEADWFLVQCYLKNLPDQKENLLGALNKITTSQKTHNYKKRAQLLKEALE